MPKKNANPKKKEYDKKEFLRKAARRY